MDSLPQTFARAQALHQAGRLREAEPLYRAVLEQLPANVVAQHRLGMLLLQSHRADEAEPLLRASVVASESASPGATPAASRPPPEAAAHLGLALHQLERYEEALHWLDRADPAAIGARLPFWRANTLVELGRLDEALAAFDRALVLEPGFAEAHRNRGILLLLRGDYARGLEDYEHRRPVDAGRRVQHGVQAPDWHGEPLAGRRIAVTDATGFGDELQFCRYLPLLADRGAEVTFLGNPKLYRLLATLDRRVRLLADGSGEAFDFHCKLLSLPLRFGTRIDTVPAATPYLHAEAERVAHWRARIGEDGFRVGVAWRGSPRRGIDAGRAFPLAALAPLAALPGVRLVSLQKGPGEEELEALPADMRVERLGAEFDAGADAFVDTAAAMMSLDLVVSSCTSVPHLAGALRRPTWVALKPVPEWRWGLGRDDTPWYPEMRLFRQAMRGDWTPVFAAMARELHGRAG